MKAIISTNYDPKYVFFMPIVEWCWNKLGIEVVFLCPSTASQKSLDLFEFVRDWVVNVKTQLNFYRFFNVPTENHEVTYTQVSRLFGAANASILDDEILISGDIDMAVFSVPPHDLNGAFSVFGADLVPPNQYPICYLTATAAAWRNTFVKGRTLQQCLDDALAAENCENMRGNLWSRDQDLAHQYINPTSPILFNRAYEGTQFATKRVDRDNVFWHTDILNRGNNDIVDAHLWRPGYTEENVEKIIRLFTIMYPHDSFEWIREYAAEFRNAINQ